MGENVFGDVRTYYVFSLTSELYALDTSVIKGVKAGDQFHLKSSDNSTPSIVGTIDWGEKTIPVIDLRLVYCQEGTPEFQTDIVIVIEILLSKERKRVGLLIDGYVDIQNVRAADIKKTNLWQPLINEMFLSSRFSEKTQPIKIIDVAEILAAIERSSNISFASLL